MHTTYASTLAHPHNTNEKTVICQACQRSRWRAAVGEELGAVKPLELAFEGQELGLWV